MGTRSVSADQPSGDSAVLKNAESDTDSSLIRRCLDGDRACFGQLVTRYEKVIFNVALRMVGDEEDARDIVQNAFIKAYEKLRSYDSKYKFFSWIYKITVNESLNLLGRRRPAEELSENLVSKERSPSEAVEHRELAEALQAAILRMSIHHREVLVLRHFLGLSYREMADAIGISEKTVKSRLYEARRRLCDLVIPEGRTE